MKAPSRNLGDEVIVEETEFCVTPWSGLSPESMLLLPQAQLSRWGFTEEPLECPGAGAPVRPWAGGLGNWLTQSTCCQLQTHNRADPQPACCAL